MFLNSIRWRLQLWHGLLLVVVLTGFGLTAYQLQRATHLRRIDQELQQRVTVAGALARRPNDRPGRPPFERFPPPNRSPEIPRFSNPENYQPRERVGEQGSEFGPPNAPIPSRSPEGEPRNETPRPPPWERPRPATDKPSFNEGVALSQKEIHLSPQALRLFEATGSNSYYYVIWTRDGKILSQSDTAPAGVPWPGGMGLRNKNVPSGPEPIQLRVRGNQREMFHHTPMGDCILAGINISLEVAEMRRFAGVLLGAGSGVLLFGLAGGWWLSNRAIRPIKTISATAARIAEGDLSQRIPVKDSENELDQLASVLNSTFARLDAAFAQQAQFTSDAAHELRTPLSVILTQTQSILTRERSSGEYCETLEACQRAAQRMRRLVESLLELARLDAGQTLKKEQLDLGKIISECVELLKPLADERKISVHSVVPSFFCVGDADRLKQVFTNLISNAIYYNKDGGQIQITAERKTDGATVTIADTGVGISAENLPYVFERFWRADQSRSHSDGHSGLGLSIVKAILDMHHGTIDVVSEPGRGSTFIVRLPD